MTSLVSICIPVFNSELFIEDTLACLCAQTYQNIELVVVNDGSTDNSEILVQKNGDPRIKLISIENGGAAKARNIAHQNAKGKYIIFFDADDHISPDFIEKQLNIIREQEDVVVLAAWGRFYNNNLSTFKKEPIPKNPIDFNNWIKIYWRNGCPMTNPGRVLIPNKLLDLAGVWNEQLTVNDDFEFFTRVFIHAKTIIFNSDTSLYYRSGVGGLSSQKNSKGIRSYFDSIWIAIRKVRSFYPNDSSLNISYANILQLFVYSTFPKYSSLVKKAERHIAEFGGSDLPYPSGKITRFLSKLIGWKAAKLLRSLLPLL